MPDTRPSVVLDTNVVLDCFVFQNTECVELLRAIMSRAVTWRASPEMRDELLRVVSVGHLNAWHPDPTELSEQWDRWCSESPPAAVSTPMGRLRCTDPDDQKFIDFSIWVGARWLVSRDRAVLKLARRMREYGIEVIRPPGWTLSAA